jgi:uncharacterized protein (TIGR03083 family)
MPATLIDVSTIAPLRHREAMTLASGECARLLDLLERLDGDDWSRATDCDEWDVADMVRHLLGAAEGNASVRENLHQMRAGASWGKAHGRPLVDGLGAVQIADRSQLTPAELVARYREVVPKALKRRAGLPAPIRRLVRMKVEVPGIVERWTLGYLIDVIYTRDAWMHRVDISRATGRELALDADHDGRLLADIVAEWARRHARPFVLELTGPLSVTYTSGEGGERFTVDAVEFARVVSKREPGTGLLAQPVPF